MFKQITFHFTLCNKYIGWSRYVCTCKSWPTCLYPSDRKLTKCTLNKFKSIFLHFGKDIYRQQTYVEANLKKAVESWRHQGNTGNGLTIKPETGSFCPTLSRFFFSLSTSKYFHWKRIIYSSTLLPKDARIQNGLAKSKILC
jgi:hypothetical protein